ncbi:MAG: hypothetical protein AUI14_24090 [Actinobacteria bacterium 13_2_20CM_2_71_6]|nr:MAG: hypothetical protein AUI14_24090 [Actinobacteria bacterium 13_2_20CM_2_71_6]
MSQSMYHFAVQELVGKEARSALPDAPVVPEPPPRFRRVRMTAARTLAWTAGRADALAGRLAPVDLARVDEIRC